MTTTQNQQEAMNNLEARHGLCLGNDFHTIATGQTIVTMRFEINDRDGFPVEREYKIYPTGLVTRA